EELASWMDASRETVARALQTLRQRGRVRTGWRRLTVVPAHPSRATRPAPPSARPGQPDRVHTS
ncbi:helix-turn-helix domain-containing protein, partial [Actinomadura nitritigenes]|uniref:helix-turn-helix domain-containing protein n=1 Tax=Actinomadura nitritigenes TaxID=134602 RepID=UPI003D8BA0C6